MNYRTPNYANYKSIFPSLEADYLNGVYVRLLNIVSEISGEFIDDLEDWVNEIESYALNQSLVAMGRSYKKEVKTIIFRIDTLVNCCLSYNWSLPDNRRPHDIVDSMKHELPSRVNDYDTCLRTYAIYKAR